MKKNESTLQLKENFIEERQSATNMKEIADRYNVSVSTCYDVAREISEEDKIPYEELLFYPGRGNKIGSHCVGTETIDLGSFWKKYQNTLEQLKAVEETLKRMEA